jgi:hypothetical protein
MTAYALNDKSEITGFNNVALKYNVSNGAGISPSQAQYGNKVEINVHNSVITEVIQYDLNDYSAKLPTDLYYGSIRQLYLNATGYGEVHIVVTPL